MVVRIEHHTNSFNTRHLRDQSSSTSLTLSTVNVPMLRAMNVWPHSTGAFLFFPGLTTNSYIVPKERSLAEIAKTHNREEMRDKPAAGPVRPGTSRDIPVFGYAREGHNSTRHERHNTASTNSDKQEKRVVLSHACNGRLCLLDNDPHAMD
jgi:hypothetical protein